ncbi:uncharacterized protein LOC116350212 isoform X2 [Contarinia nasturtii]|uniref:uncharacterized protein LOC116350212 isoform X2 n=1 Tax=Contarinia nasturtii TaxID=265458 RepID=UPI0012D3ABEF|nr:uncharacterized protein LOC116350212 isoform X2 [Contarinia nasturtii]
MKRLLFVLLICISLEHVSLQEQKQQQEIQNLQEQMFFESLSEYEKQTLPCFKESFLSLRGQNDTKVLDVSDVPKGREELRTRYKNISSQVIDDTIECFMKINDLAVRNNLMIDRLKMLGATSFVLNATYVEKKQKDFANKMGQENYEFLREDYNECLELLETDLSKKLTPDIVSRIMSFHRMIYGNRREIETALKYLYGP